VFLDGSDVRANAFLGQFIRCTQLAEHVHAPGQIFGERNVELAEFLASFRVGIAEVTDSSPSLGILNPVTKAAYDMGLEPNPDRPAAIRANFSVDLRREWRTYGGRSVSLSGK
jgi:hypothetical protein